jgi:ankyrin repeat protein
VTRTQLAAIVAGSALATGFAQEPPPRIDFLRDVQPIFRQHCYSCHGPTVHQAGLRLDRRADAMRGGTIAVIGPGTSEASRLYLRVAGKRDARMPPTAPLTDAQIDTIKNWIDQGAVWPDEAAGEAAPRPTPALMRAVLYDDISAVKKLLEAGADPNARSESGATALMWAVGDEAKARLLVEHGADVNAASDDGRTPLLVAVGRQGAAPVVRLLLERGANMSVVALGSTPLLEATFTGDEAVLRLLLGAGIDVQKYGAIAVALSLQQGCRSCADLIAAKLSPRQLEAAVPVIVPPNGDARNLGYLLEHGLDPTMKGPNGRTLLIDACAAEAVPSSLIRAMIERGADVSATADGGVTAAARARMHGDTAVVDVLRTAGAALPDRPDEGEVPPPSPAASARAAVVRSLPLLQRNDVSFLKKAGCVSCHHNSLAAMAVAAARSQGIAVDAATTRTQTDATVRYIESWRERSLVAVGIPGDHDTISYILLGLAAAQHPRDENTDALAWFLERMQAANGQWRILAHRPPIESSDIEVTAASMRALQLYAPRVAGDRFNSAIKRAAAWLLQATATTTEDRAFRLLGLGWSGAARAAVDAAASDLIATQRADGGWAQLPSLASDAYATGQALVALLDSGAASPKSLAFRRGAQFLLSTQLADGSWFVKTRALPIQPYFESGFPHGRNQFISAAATAWAVNALARAQ